MARLCTPLPESPDTPLEGPPWGFTWIGAISSLDYYIRLEQAAIEADEAKGWYVEFSKFQLRDLVLVREYLLTEHEEKMGYPFQYKYPTPVAGQDS
jgi:hypothetical protein